MFSCCRADSFCFGIIHENPRILSAEVFFLERRSEGSAAFLILSAALIAAALVVWILGRATFGKQPDMPFEQSVLVSAEGEKYAHG